MRDDRKRASGSKRYGYKWKKERLAYLAKHATCVGFGKDAACTATATCIDHIVAHNGNAAKYWNTKNWQPMCAHCHSSKTAREMMLHPPKAGFDASGRPTDENHHWNSQT